MRGVRSSRGWGWRTKVRGVRSSRGEWHTNMRGVGSPRGRVTHTRAAGVALSDCDRRSSARIPSTTVRFRAKKRDNSRRHGECSMITARGHERSQAAVDPATDFQTEGFLAWLTCSRREADRESACGGVLGAGRVLRVHTRSRRSGELHGGSAVGTVAIGGVGTCRASMRPRWWRGPRGL